MDSRGFEIIPLLKSPAKIYLFAGHDTAISAVLNSFNIYDGDQPPFTAALILELHGPHKSSNEEDYIVKVKVKLKTDFS